MAATMAKKMKNMTLIDDGGDAGEEDHEDATHDDENTKRVKINVKDSGHMNIFPQTPPGVVSGLPNMTPTFSRSWLVKMHVVLALLMTAANLRKA